MKLIDADAAIEAVHNCYDNFLDFTSTGETVADSIEDILSELPSAQPEYEPVTAEDFAKTMSENTFYGFDSWFNIASKLMKELGFVICKKTM